MPAIFKAFASIAVWVLFIFGLLAVIYGFVRAFIGETLPMVTAYFGFGIGSLFLSVVAAKLRKALE